MRSLVALSLVVLLAGCASMERKLAEQISLSQSRAAEQAKNPVNAPAFDTSAITIVYKSRGGEHPGEVQTGLHNNASWEYWADHPTYILFGKNGSTIKMPKTASNGMEKVGDTVYLK